MYCFPDYVTPALLDPDSFVVSKERQTLAVHALLSLNKREDAWLHKVAHFSVGSPTSTISNLSLPRGYGESTFCGRKKMKFINIEASQIL